MTANHMLEAVRRMIRRDKKASTRGVSTIRLHLDDWEAMGCPQSVVLYDGKRAFIEPTGKYQGLVRWFYTKKAKRTAWVK